MMDLLLITLGMPTEYKEAASARFKQLKKMAQHSQWERLPVIFICFLSFTMSKQLLQKVI